MKILWIVNMLLPDAADHLGVKTGSSGTWMIDISRMIADSEKVELGVACIFGDKYCDFEHRGIRYFVLPGNGKDMLFYSKKIEKMWPRVFESFKPDIVHIHGTEYSHGLSFLRQYPNVKSVISIQGVLSRIKDVDFGGIPVGKLFWYRTLRQNIHLNGEIELHFIHKINAKYEQEMLRRVEYVNGVNTWDISLCQSINPSLKTFQIEYNLRDSFYSSEKWSFEKVERHSIFTNPAGVPLKGLHKLLEAVSILKRKYPDIKVYVPGMSSGDGKLSVSGAYAKYIAKIIKDNDLTRNVCFVGRLNEQEMVERMLSANVVVIPSAIEGTSLILREAMYLGCPCIASFRGGMADFISDKYDGFLYDFQESPYLAARISELFDNDQKSLEISKNAIIKAEKAHDRETNIMAYMNMYNVIYNSL